MKRTILPLTITLVVQFLSNGVQAKPIKDEVLKVTFPERIGAFVLQGQQHYNSPGLGYSLRYQDESLFKADVYVYDKNMADIGDWADSERITHEFESVGKDLHFMEREGKYADVKQLGMGATSFAEGSLQFFWSRHRYRQLQGENVADLGFRVSETYLSAKHGKFIKIRLTLVEKDFKKRELDINRFVKELAGILGSHKSPAARIELRPLTDTAEEPATRSEDQIIEALIAKLGAPDFRDRRAAERDLLEIGKPAVPFLQAQKEHWDPEIRTRIKEVLATINAEPKNAGMKDFRIYRVGRGEDLYSVALLWNVSVQRLKEFNRLEGTGLAVGQEIKIPLFP